jgi:hypothetical protein
MHGGRSPRRGRRRQGRGGGHRTLVGGLAVAAIAIVVYAAFFRPATSGQSTLRLPNLGQAFETAGKCRAGAYPPGAQYAFERCISGRSPVGWPRCAKVTYSVDGARAPAGYRPDVQQAMATLAAATGLHLLPATHAADIRISWDPSLYNPVPGSSGEAGETDFRTASGLSGVHVESATVRISSHLATGASPGLGEIPVLLHELGHAVGLAHQSGPVVMNPVDRGFTNYQPGDLAGFTALYRPASCTAG